MHHNSWPAGLRCPDRDVQGWTDNCCVRLCSQNTYTHTGTDTQSYFHAIVPVLKHKGTRWFNPWQNCEDEELLRLQLAPLEDVIGEGPVPKPKVARMWEVIKNSTSGADGSARRGSICPLKWCKHNPQGVRETIPPWRKREKAAGWTEIIVKLYM